MGKFDSKSDAEPITHGSMSITQKSRRKRHSQRGGHVLQQNHDVCDGERSGDVDKQARDHPPDRRQVGSLRCRRLGRDEGLALSAVAASDVCYVRHALLARRVCDVDAAAVVPCGRTRHDVFVANNAQRRRVVTLL